MKIQNITDVRLTFCETLLLFFILYVGLFFIYAFLNPLTQYSNFSYFEYFLRTIFLNASLLLGVFCDWGESESKKMQPQVSSNLLVIHHLVINLSMMFFCFWRCKNIVYGYELPAPCVLIIVLYSSYLSLVIYHAMEKRHIFLVAGLIIVGFTFSLIVKNKIPLLFCFLGLISSYETLRFKVPINMLKIFLYFVVVILTLITQAILRDGRIEDFHFFWPSEFVEIYINAKIPLYLDYVQYEKFFKWTIWNEFLSGIPKFLYENRPDAAPVVFAKETSLVEYHPGIGKGFDALIWFEVYFGKLAAIFVFAYGIFVKKTIYFISDYLLKYSNLRNFVFGGGIVIWYVHFMRGAIFGSLKISILFVLSIFLFEKLAKKIE